MVDLADQIVFGDRVRAGLVQLAAIDNADANVGPAEFNISHLLIGKAVLISRHKAAPTSGALNWRLSRGVVLHNGRKLNVVR